MKSNRQENPRFKGKYQEPHEIGKIYDQHLSKAKKNPLFDELLTPIANNFNILLSEIFNTKATEKNSKEDSDN